MLDSHIRPVAGPHSTNKPAPRNKQEAYFSTYFNEPRLHETLPQYYHKIQRAFSDNRWFNFVEKLKPHFYNAAFLENFMKAFNHCMEELPAFQATYQRVVSSISQKEQQTTKALPPPESTTAVPSKELQIDPKCVQLYWFIHTTHHFVHIATDILIVYSALKKLKQPRSHPDVPQALQVKLRNTFFKNQLTKKALLALASLHGNFVTLLATDPDLTPLLSKLTASELTFIGLYNGCNYIQELEDNMLQRLLAVPHVQKTLKREHYLQLARYRYDEQRFCPFGIRTLLSYSFVTKTFKEEDFRILLEHKTPETIEKILKNNPELAVHIPLKYWLDRAKKNHGFYKIILGTPTIHIQIFARDLVIVIKDALILNKKLVKEFLRLNLSRFNSTLGGYDLYHFQETCAQYYGREDDDKEELDNKEFMLKIYKLYRKKENYAPPKYGS